MREKSLKNKNVLILSGALTVVVCVAALLVLFLVRNHNVKNQLESRQIQAESGPKLVVVEAKSSENFRDIELIGESRPFITNQLYARVSGFLKSLEVDKGDHVKQGQLLATIESPETDKAYLSALADYRNKKHIADRARTLRKRALISAQEEEQATSNADIARDALDVETVLRGYETIKAPFDGVISARFTDPGELIQNATNSATSSQVLLTISKTDELRVYVYVDQKDAVYVHPGCPVELTSLDEAAQPQHEQVARTAGELDPKTRTLLTEIDVKNPDGKIVAGSLLKIKLRVFTPSYPQVPAKALIMKDNSTYVPVVAQDSTLHYRKVEMGENDGVNLKVLRGLKPGERVALDVGNNMAEGQKVQQQAMAGEKKG